MLQLQKQKESIRKNKNTKSNMFLLKSLCGGGHRRETFWGTTVFCVGCHDRILGCLPLLPFPPSLPPSLPVYLLTWLTLPSYPSLPSSLPHITSIPSLLFPSIYDQHLSSLPIYLHTWLTLPSYPFLPPSLPSFLSFSHDSLYILIVCSAASLIHIHWRGRLYFYHCSRGSLHRHYPITIWHLAGKTSTLILKPQRRGRKIPPSTLL